MILALGAAAIVPGLFLVWFFHAMDVHKEPPKVLWATFGLGILTIPFVLLLVWPIDPFISMISNPYAKGTADAFFEAAIPEELLKYAVLLGFAYRHREFDEPMDGVVYGATASLGFATLENVLYVGSGGLGVAILRAVTAVPGHACSGVIMGYFVGRAKFEPLNKSKLLAAGLFFPTLLHGLYDAPLLIMKAFDELDVSKDGHEAVLGVLLIFWIGAFLFEVIWALRLAARLRQAQLEHVAVHGMPAKASQGPAPHRPHRLKGWVQIAIGVVLGSVGGVMTLGIALAASSDLTAEGWGVALVVAMVVGILPLGLGVMLFFFGLRNLNKTAPAA